MTALISLRDNLRWSKLHVITDLAGGARQVAAKDFPAWVADLFDAGADVVQVRDPRLAQPECRQMLEQTQEVAFGRRALFVIGRDLAAAAAIQADLLQLGASDGPLAAARRQLHEYALIGRSVHSAEQWEHARSEADWLAVGPVFGNEVEGRPVPGLDLLALAAGSLGPDDLPWVAVGGITADNLDEVVATGAKRIAVSSAVLGASDPLAACSNLADRMRAAVGSSLTFPGSTQPPALSQ